MVIFYNGPNSLILY